MIAFTLIENNLGVSIAILIMIVITVFNFIFSARSFELALIISIITYGLMIPFYYEMGWDYTLPFKIMLLCVVLMAITINTKTSGETII